MRTGLTQTILILSGALLAGAEDKLAADAREFAAALRLEQKADEDLFVRVGPERAVALLQEAAQRGARLEATATEWAEMHRAYTGLVEFHLWRGDFYAAGNMAGLQSLMYRMKERDYNSALLSARQALELHQRSGRPHDYSLDWTAIGQNLFSLSQLDAARHAFLSARTALREPHSNNAGHLRRQMVLVELARQDRRAAEQESNDFLQDSKGANAVFRGLALVARADLLIEMERYGQALEAGKEALTVAAQDPKGDAVALAANSVALLAILAASRSLPYGEAIDLARRAASEFSNLPVSPVPFARKAIETRRRLAGDFAALLRERTGELDRARASGDRNTQIEALSSLALVYGSLQAGRLRTALLEEAAGLVTEQVRQAEGKPDAGTEQVYLRTLGLLGESYLGLREAGKAGRVFAEVTRYIDARSGEAATRLARHYGAARVGRARVAELDDDPDTARSELEKVEKNARAWRIRLSEVLLRRARLERSSLGRVPAVIRYYERAIEAAAEERDRIREANLLLELASYSGTGSAARSLLDTARRQADALQQAGLLWRIDYTAGLLAERDGAADAAIGEYQRAVSRLESMRAELGLPELRQLLVDDATSEDLYQRLVGLLTRQERGPEAWQIAENARARSFREMLASRRGDGPAPSTGLRRVHALENEITGLQLESEPSYESLLRAAGREPASIRGRLRKLETELALARQEVSLLDAPGAPSGNAKSIEIAEVARLVPSGTALVEYALLPDGVTAFVVTTKGWRQFGWKADPRVLRTEVVRLRGLIANPESGAELKRSIKTLSALLLTPVAAGIPAGTTHLILVPTSFLWSVPFQVLQLAPGEFLIDRYSLRYVPAASMLSRPKGSRRDGENLFLGALGNEKVEGMAPLPGTLRETEAIARLYPRATRLTGSQFTRSAIQRALATFSRVHLATHGMLEEQAPLFSALLASSASGEPARFSLYELLHLRVRSRLVVLSACETGLGRLQGGDEIVGLTRAFLLAGASTVVSSLWKVSDDSTALLMEEFHRALRSRRPAADALRLASLAVRARYPHPFFWAPFLSTGAE